MKTICFFRDTLRTIRAFPSPVRRAVGYQLRRVQSGEQPDDFKPMPSVGPGVEEIRIRDDAGAFRVLYTARIAGTVYVLHAFQKKSQATPHHDIEVARSRYKELIRELRNGT